MFSKSTLILVGVPIGNPDDISKRAVQALKKADLLLVEDRKTAAKLFKYWDIPFPRDSWELLNEHTRPEELDEIVRRIESIETTVLISDAGMPVICDPGADLVHRVSERGVSIVVIPGPSALVTALVRSGVGGHGFHFVGYPPRESGDRKRFFRDLRNPRVPTAFYETPYRLHKVIDELSQSLADNDRVFIGVNLTAENEFVLTSSAKGLKARSGSVPKGPPVFIVYREE